MRKDKLSDQNSISLLCMLPETAAMAAGDGHKKFLEGLLVGCQTPSEGTL